MIALQPRHGQAAHLVEDRLRIHVGRDDQLPARVGRQRPGSVDLCANELVVGLPVSEKGEAKEEATHNARARMQPLAVLGELGQPQTRRRLGQAWWERIGRIVLVAEEVGMGVENAVGQKRQDFPLEKGTVGFLKRKHGGAPRTTDGQRRIGKSTEPGGGRVLSSRRRLSGRQDCPAPNRRAQPAKPRLPPRLSGGCLHRCGPASP